VFAATCIFPIVRRWKREGFGYQSFAWFFLVLFGFRMVKKAI
jgi:hypothetical protein